MNLAFPNHPSSRQFSHLSGAYSPRRPSTIAELTERARDFQWDASLSLGQALSAAETQCKTSAAVMNAGDLELEFVHLWRAFIMMTETVPAHKDYSTRLSRAARKKFESRGQGLLVNLDTMKDALTVRFDRWAAANPEAAAQLAAPSFAGSGQDARAISSDTRHSPPGSSITESHFAREYFDRRHSGGTPAVLSGPQDTPPLPSASSSMNTNGKSQSPHASSTSSLPQPPPTLDYPSSHPASAPAMSSTSTSTDLQRLLPAELALLRRLTDQNVPSSLLNTIIESMVHSREIIPPPDREMQGSTSGGNGTGRRMPQFADYELEDAPPAYEAFSG